MCMLYVKESGVVLPRIFWDALNASNREGAGLFNITKNEIIKTQNYEDAWTYINENKADKIVVHHRLATSGPKTVDQLHGWDMENGYVFFHNGVLKTYQGNTTHSDTQQLVEEWTGAPVKAFVRYLEAFEKTSRFLLIHRETGEIIKPKCARWNPVRIHEIGHTIDFSNDYAMNYSMLPPAYARWSGYDDDWRYGGSTQTYFTNGSNVKKTHTTRSGAKTTKRVASVFEQKNVALKNESLNLVGTNAYDTKRSTYVNRDLGLEFMSEPTKVVGTNDLYVMPDIVRLAGTHDYILGEDIINFRDGKSELSVINHEWADLITMNDLILCGSSDIAKAYVRIARASDVVKIPNSDVKNASLFKYVRSYELRVGHRPSLELTLAQFISMATQVETLVAGDKDNLLSEMRVSSIFLDVLADELTTNGNFKYFKALSKRVIVKFLLDFGDANKAEKEAKEKETTNLGKSQTFTTLDSMDILMEDINTKTYLKDLYERAKNLH